MEELEKNLTMTVLSVRTTTITTTYPLKMDTSASVNTISSSSVVMTKNQMNFEQFTIKQSSSNK
jgi:hypothetical protein